MTQVGPRCVLGVTGNIATGKSTVVEFVKELGATHFDADLVYRELVDAGQPLLVALAAHFGDEILASDGSLDRSKLGAIVFSDPAKLRELDNLTHPAVIAEIDLRVARTDADQIVVIDAVKLIESGHADHCDEVWLVNTSIEMQVARLMKRNILSEVEARRRIASQPPVGQKLERADRVIDNSGNLEQTRQQVADAWRSFIQSPGCNQSRGASNHGNTGKS